VDKGGYWRQHRQQWRWSCERKKMHQHPEDLPLGLPGNPRSGNAMLATSTTAPFPCAFFGKKPFAKSIISAKLPGLTCHCHA